MSPKPELGPFKRQPRLKQLECLQKSADREYYAIFFEQRCGKSQVVLDTAAYNYRLGRIDMLLIIAPNGVHRNWITDEIPSALPDDVNAKCVLWQSGKMEQVKRQQDLRELLAHEGLAVLSVNIDALLSDYTKKTIKFFQQKRKVLAVVDECFVGETPVTTPDGDRRIDQIKEGDHVLTWQGFMRVKKVNVKQSSILTIIKTEDGRSVTTTPNHPFFTDQGWMSAGLLNQKERKIYDRHSMSKLWSGEETCQSAISRKAFMPKLRREGEWLDQCGSEQEVGGRVHLPILQMHIHEKVQPRRSHAEILQSILRSEIEDGRPNLSSEGLYDRAGKEDQLSEEGEGNGTASVSPWMASFGCDDRAIERIRESPVGAVCIDQGWERKADTTDDETAYDSIRLALDYGARHRIGRKAARLSNQLQGRFGDSGREAGNRSGRVITQRFGGAGAGSEEGREIGGVRVDSVENKTLDHPVNVYDLTLEGCPHFFAGGFLVHNCLDISNPGAKRTKQALAIGRNSVMRRILDGTPVDASPLGLYSQCNFLRHGLLGHNTYASFKNYYGDWDLTAPFPKLRGYKNLNELQDNLRSFSMRVTRQECVDLPPKVREKRYFSLPPEHRRIYEQMRRDFIAELGDKILDAPLAMTRYLRLQQITSNHLPMKGDPTPCQHCLGQTEDCPTCDGYGVIAAQETLERISEHDPRLEAFADVVSKTQGQGIVWAKFRADYEALAAWAKRERVPVVFYHGSVHPDERAEAIRKFQRGEARLFIGNPRSGGRGIDLSAANFVVYYSLDWPLRWRRQSEDRAISLAKLDSVLYFDLIAEHTVDEKIISALRSGKELSDLVTGDKPENWL